MTTWIDDSPRRLLFIGAGASFGARDGIVNPAPPLGPDLMDYLAERLPMFTDCKHEFHRRSPRDSEEDARLERFFADPLYRPKAFEPAINALIERERDERQPLLHALNRLLACSFSYGTKRQPSLTFQPLRDLYDDLIERLDIDASWRIITLNYDTLFEAALERQRRQFVYPGLTMGLHPATESSPGAIPVYKPHGSINWFVPHTEEFTYNKTAPDEQPFDARKIHHGDFQTRDLVGTSVDDTYDVPTCQVSQRLRGGGTPVMAHFCKEKPALLNLRTLRQIRTQCVNGLNRVEQAVIIGVRPVAAGDDAIVDNIFEELRGPRTEYVNPSEKEVARVAERYRFNGKSMTLKDWLKQAACDASSVTTI